MDSKQTPIDPPSPPPMLSGAELYDSIMGAIEPELVSSNLPNIRVVAQSDTPEARASRLKRYQVAFAEYDKRFAQYCRQWNEQLKTYKREAIRYIESETQDSDRQDLDAIQSAISQ